MKKLFILFTLVLSFPSLRAQVLEAHPFQEMLNALQKEEFTHKERGLVFGFNTIQSCLFVSKEFAVFKNYCFPVRNYPAKGYTIVSKKYGIIDLYEERLPEALKRDIRISEFPELVAPYLTHPFEEMSVLKLNDIFETTYYQYNPACWSTSYSPYHEIPEANCTIDSQIVSGFDSWSQETQKIVLNEQTWTALLKEVDRILNQYPQ